MAADPAEAVAQIAVARRSRLLRVHRRRLRWEDLEDCYSQATLELVARSRRDPFLSPAHVVNALEQKFLSRIEDRRRAIGGRSAIESAIARAVPIEAPDREAGELEDRVAAVENQVIARTELSRLREVIADLSRDQQLVLASQVYVDMGVSEFCARFGWSVEEYERGERCRRLEPDLLALSAGVADGERLGAARAHLANCAPCARMVGDLDRAARSIAALLPAPGALAGGARIGRLAPVWGTLRRAAAIARHPLAETGLGGGTGVAGGGAVGVGALKVGLAAVCVAGAAGSYAVCARLGVLPAVGLGRAPAHVAAPRRTVAAALPAHAGVKAGARVAVGAAAVAPSPVRHVHLSAVAQIRREFGTPLGHAAARSDTGGGAPRPAGASAAGLAATPRATAAQVRQEQAEFGFEK
jgi:DNA-directed RNA polymerase specialized sigma24 family protein